MADLDDDDILRKADALLWRYHPGRSTSSRSADFPVLTEVVEEAGTPPSLPPSAPAPPLTDEELAQLEQDLRLQLLELIGPELERLLEAKVHERLGAKIEEVMAVTRKALEAEVRAVVREALAEVIAAETDRLRIEVNLG